ncbi:MAG: hypothetical protein KDC12_13050 [Flavobacteriales bacterium]|nr:hypothetical protein [Flavobacteriales bacterium]
MKSFIATVSLILLIASTGLAQKKFERISSQEGLEAYAKWGTAKVDGQKKSVILLKLINTNDSAIVYSLDVEFFFQGKRVEAFEQESACIDGGKTHQGKLNGLYFYSETLSSEQITSDDFEYVITVTPQGKEGKCD